MASIYYRFGSERGIWRELNIDVDFSGGLLVSDLKILIAEETNLSHEFARRTDLSLSSYDESGNTTQLDDNCLVHQGERIVVNRVAWTKAPNIVHEASKQLSVLEVDPSPTQETSLPESLICQLCQETMKTPVLVKCTLACGASGCKKCVLEAIEKKCENEGVQDGVESEASGSKKCPFCKKGHVTAITINRRLQSLLASIEDSNNNNGNKDNADQNDQLDIDMDKDSTNKTDFNKGQVEYDNLPTFSYPSHYVYLLSPELFELVRNTGYTLIAEGQRSWLGVFLDSECDSAEAKIIPISLVGGGTSYVLGGVFKLSLKSRVQLDYDISGKEFNEQALNLGVDTQDLAIYRVNWINKFSDTPMVPIRKHPFSILMSNHTLKNNNEILSSKKVLFKECTEIAIDEPTFKLVVNAHKAFPNIVKKVPNDDKKKAKRANWRDYCYPGGATPLPLDFGNGNPYAGYCHLLPFLSEPQFQLIKMAQEQLKISFLKSFKKNVIKSIKRGKMSRDAGEELLGRLYDNLNQKAAPSVETSPIGV